MTKDYALTLAQRALSNKNASAKSIYEALAAINAALKQPEQERPAFAERKSKYVRDNLHKLKVAQPSRGLENT